MKILVIGNPQAVLGFALVGVQGMAATNAEDANQALTAALADPEAGIVLITDDIADLIEARMDELKLHSTIPLVVEIPGPEGVRPDRPSLNDIMLRAIGVKL